MYGGAVMFQGWFQELIDDLKSILTETEFTARWTIIEGYHALGTRLLQDFNNFERAQIYGEEICNAVAECLGKSPRTIYYAVQFARMYPDLNALPEGKNTSWSKICKNYLAAPKAEDKREEYVICTKCGEQVFPIVVRCRCGHEFEITRKDIKK